MCGVLQVCSQLCLHIHGSGKPKNRVQLTGMKLDRQALLSSALLCSAIKWSIWPRCSVFGLMIML
jgi:hypothetical protein